MPLYCEHSSARGLNDVEGCGALLSGGRLVWTSRGGLSDHGKSSSLFSVSKSTSDASLDFEVFSVAGGTEARGMEHEGIELGIVHTCVAVGISLGREDPHGIDRYRGMVDTGGLIVTQSA